MFSFGYSSPEFQHLDGFSSMDVGMMDMSLHETSDGEGSARYEDHNYDQMSLTPDFNAMSLQGAPATYSTSHDIVSRQTPPVSFKEAGSGTSRNAPVSNSNIGARKRLNSAGPHQCLTCLTSFTQRKSLLRHSRLVHSTAASSSKHTCPICDEEFVRTYDRDRHVKFQHNSVKTKCKYCDRELSVRSLHDHWKTTSCVEAQFALPTKKQVDTGRDINPEYTTTPITLGSVSVVNIWVISAELFGHLNTLRETHELHVDLDSERNPHLLELKAVALQTMNTSLASCNSSNALEVVASLCLFSLVFDPYTGQTSKAIRILTGQWLADRDYECTHTLLSQDRVVVYFRGDSRSIMFQDCDGRSDQALRAWHNNLAEPYIP